MLPNKNAPPPCGNSFQLQTHDPKIQMDSRNKLSDQPISFSFHLVWLLVLRGLLSDEVIRNPPGNGGDARDSGLYPGLRRSPGVENDNPLQYFCLDTSSDRGACQATVDRVAMRWTGLSSWAQHSIVLFLCGLQPNLSLSTQPLSSTLVLSFQLFGSISHLIALLPLKIP